MNPENPHKISSTPAQGSLARDFSLGMLLGLLLIGLWCFALVATPTDRHQGDVYRIIYLHVPCAFTAFFCGFVLLIFSILGLKTKNERFLMTCVAATEVGLLFTALTLATGSIWGRPTWGVWWTWDARLTTTFILAILFVAYLLVHRALSFGPQRITACGILGILIGLDIPIIYKSVTWWRTLHQPQTIFRPGGSSTIEPEMLRILIAGIAIMVGLSYWLILQRRKNLQLAEELETKSLA